MYHEHHTTSSTAVTATTTTAMRGNKSSSNLLRQRKQKKMSKQEEIDHYAQQLLEYTARCCVHHDCTQEDETTTPTNSSNIDDSLGSYITNCLRTSLHEMNVHEGTTSEDVIVSTTTMSQQPEPVDITTIPDYESFCELIQEHCQFNLMVQNDDDDCMIHPMAIQILQKIFNVLITQQIPYDELHIFENSKNKKQLQSHQSSQPSLLLSNDNNNNTTTTLTMNDLQLEIDIRNSYDSLEQQQQQQQPILDIVPTSILPGIGQSLDVSTIATNPEPNLITPQQHDIIEDVSQPQQQQEEQLQEQYEQQHQYYEDQDCGVYQYENDVDEYIRSNIINTLLQWYVSQDLSYDAAYAATILSNNNIILAQYIISMAFTQIPICKHLINDMKCYRADCTFNHNIDHHTCVFWMKSRGCSKKDSTIDQCRFLHGFSTKLLENIPESIQIQIDMAYQTHNTNSSTIITPYRNLRDLYASTTSSSIPSTNTVEDSFSNNNIAISNSKSFANIAVKGYNTQKSFTSPSDSQPLQQSVAINTTTTTTTNIATMIQQLSNMMIPQYLWQAHENRNASAFHINDPLERYYTVANSTSKGTTAGSNNNTNVIDLHYQSIKTFPIVLDTILPMKLSQLQQQLSMSSSSDHKNDKNNNGIWIITGTGHSINTQRTHQKGNSTLEYAVLEYLITNFVLSENESNVNKYRIYKGRDRNGKGGAIFIQQRK